MYTRAHTHTHTHTHIYIYGQVEFEAFQKLGNPTTRRQVVW